MMLVMKNQLEILIFMRVEKLTEVITVSFGKESSTPTADAEATQHLYDTDEETDEVIKTRSM